MAVQRIRGRRLVDLQIADLRRTGRPRIKVWKDIWDIVRFVSQGRPAASPVISVPDFSPFLYLLPFHSVYVLFAFPQLFAEFSGTFRHSAAAVLPIDDY